MGCTAQTYDTRGNLASDGATTYVHDAENRLMIGPNGTSSYAYDPLGRRTAKTVPGTQTAPLWGTAVWNSFTWTAMPMVTTNFIHDGASEIAEYDGSGNLIRRFVPGPVIDEYIAMVTAGGVKTFFHTDKMGSVIAMSDTSGALTEGPFTYDAYGNCLTSAGAACPATGVPFRFTGQRYDPETGLYYFKARYYDPAKGRFLQIDPVGYGPGINWYSYAENDPTNATDPSGMCIPTACKGGDSFGSIEGCNAANGDCGPSSGYGTHDQRAAEQVLGHIITTGSGVKSNSNTIIVVSPHVDTSASYGDYETAARQQKGQLDQKRYDNNAKGLNWEWGSFVVSVGGQFFLTLLETSETPSGVNWYNPAIKDMASRYTIESYNHLHFREWSQGNAFSVFDAATNRAWSAFPGYRGMFLEYRGQTYGMAPGSSAGHFCHGTFAACLTGG